MSPTKTSDTEAMNRIHRLLDGKEWDADTTESIAAIVQQTGREIRDIEVDDDA